MNNDNDDNDDELPPNEVVLEEDEDEEDDEGDVLDGGPAELHVDVDLTLLIVCEDDLVPDHPILHAGTTVQIGLGKSTRLEAVFNRYRLLCRKGGVTIPDLEFVHNQVLHPQDTPENAALMKHDRIRVRLDQSQARAAVQESKKMQQEVDEAFFKQMKDCLGDGDVVLECENNELVPCVSCMVRVRCPWLGALIQEQTNSRRPPPEDDGIRVLNREEPPQPAAQAVRVEDDQRPRVKLDFSKPAVLLLLEYCYTNRVLSLGEQAFRQAHATKPRKRHWPTTTNKATIHVGLELIRLAGRARLPRLALMAQVYCCQVITFRSVRPALQVALDEHNPVLAKAAAGLVLQYCKNHHQQVPSDLPVRPLLWGARDLLPPSKEEWRPTFEFDRLDREERRLREREREGKVPDRRKKRKRRS